MTESVRFGLQPLSHTKAGPTTSSSRPIALPSPTHPRSDRSSSQFHTKQAPFKDELSDPSSDTATVALIRRVLCPTSNSYGASSPQPLEELLPPLTSSNDVDRQLYAILAILIKEFLYSWYSKVTPDQALVSEVLQVIAHCTRALEERIRQVDVAQLLLDDIPALVEAHILSYRLAKQRSHLSGLPTSHHALYHELNPHPGLSPVPDSRDPDTTTAQAENESDYRRLLAHGIFAILLPTEDLENSSLRTLAGDLLADLILGKEVAGRICEGRFIFEMITRLTDIVSQRKSVEEPVPKNDLTSNRLERYGLLSDEDEPTIPATVAEPRAMALIWILLRNLFLGYVALRFIATGLVRVASTPITEPSLQSGVSSYAATQGHPKEKGMEKSLSDGVTGKRPVLDYRVYSMTSQLLGIPERMPWLSGFFALVQHLILAGPGRVGDTDGVLDRFLRETIEEYVLAPTLLPNLLLAARTALFPANARPAAPSTAAVNSGGASAPALQAPLQSPTLSGKAISTASVISAAPTTIARAHPARPLSEGASASGPVSKVAGQSNGEGTNIIITAHDDNHLPRAISPGPAAPSLTMNDTTKTPSGGSLTSQANNTEFSNSEIAIIKRRCAANLLTLMPRKVARTVFGVPVPSKGDRTCSTTTGCSLPFTVISPPSPISMNESGDAPRSSQSPLSSHNSGQYTAPPSSDSGSQFVPQAGGDGSRAAERLRTDNADENPDVNVEESFLLDTIESDLLDLFGDAYCNKHLIYAIIETVVAKILPELSERSVSELMEDRGVAPIPSNLQL